MAEYTEENIVTLDWNEHIRQRPGMYIGKLGDGNSPDDGIYVLLKEVIDNAIDEFMMGFGKVVNIQIHEQKVTVRDFGRGIPLEKVVDCVAKMNTGAKYDSDAFQKSIGMNGVGVKAVNALSSFFQVVSVRDGREKRAEFECGRLVKEYPVCDTDAPNGTTVVFVPDDTIFENFHFYSEFLEKMLWNYAYLNRGLTIVFNGQKYNSKNGLYDLLSNSMNEQLVYPIVHLQEKEFELAITHAEKGNGETYFTFVNGQHTIHGGTHQQALREALVKTLREFYKKEYDAMDIRQSVCAAMSIRIQDPVFESQTKTKLGSENMKPGGPTVRWYVNDMVGRLLDNYLHRNPEVADALQKKINESEKERKEIAGIKKAAKSNNKKLNLNNRKLRDCHYHLNEKGDRGIESSLFITEGDSASGSIT
ncbi:MAG: ATP-binding protein, partial [Bacteroidales bacterium]|nr:ATP-binding protein [Bacteroidales bacterium]